MDLSNQTMRDLKVLSTIKSEGVILGHHFDLVNGHLLKGFSLTGDNLESFRIFYC